MADINPVYDAGDETHVQKKKLTTKIKRQKEEEYLKTILSTTPGRNFLFRLLKFTGAISESGWAPDPTLMAFNCGKREVGLWLIKEIDAADPRALINMQLDNVKDIDND